MVNEFPPINEPKNPLALLYGAFVMALVRAVEAVFDLEERAYLDREADES